MKKTLIALMAFVGVALGAETTVPTIKSGSYELKMDAYTLSAPELYNYLYGVFVEGGTLTFNLNVSYTGETTTNNQALLHVGQKDNGMSIYAVNGTDIVVGENNTVNAANSIATGLTEGTFAVAITLTGNAASKTAGVSVSVNGGAAITGNTLSWSAMTWTEGSDSYGRFCDKYSVNQQAPGWSGEAATITKLVSGSATYVAVPEPATATLSLLALAGLAARRRRH